MHPWRAYRRPRDGALSLGRSIGHTERRFLCGWEAEGEVEMSLVVVLVLLVLLDVAAVLSGVDSRDGRDWNR